MCVCVCVCVCVDYLINVRVHICFIIFYSFELHAVLNQLFIFHHHHYLLLIFSFFIVIFFFLLITYHVDVSVEVQVSSPLCRPHIDTSLYLSPLADKKSDVLVTQLAVNDDSGEEPGESFSILQH